MPYELNEIKSIRKKLGITQTELAQQARVSQSLIAKIEAGRIDPTYSKTIKIFQTLEELQKKSDVKAKDIMHSGMVTIRPEDDIKDALRKMKKYEISQMPVLDDNKSIGMVAESDLLEALLDEKKGHLIKDIMEDPPPVISENSGRDIITNLLRHFPMILVSSKGSIKGVITKRDFIEKMMK